MTVQRQITSAALLLLLPLLVTTLSGCATRPAVSQPVPIPPPPAALMTDDSADSQAYSQKVRDWLKRAVEELTSLRPKKLGCNATSLQSETCL